MLKYLKIMTRFKNRFKKLFNSYKTHFEAQYRNIWFTLYSRVFRIDISSEGFIPEKFSSEKSPKSYHNSLQARGLQNCRGSINLLCPGIKSGDHQFTDATCNNVCVSIFKSVNLLRYRVLCQDRSCNHCKTLTSGYKNST